MTVHGEKCFAKNSKFGAQACSWNLIVSVGSVSFAGQFSYMRGVVEEW